jgi:hypothetical protein
MEELYNSEPRLLKHVVPPGFDVMGGQDGLLKTLQQARIIYIYIALCIYHVVYNKINKTFIVINYKIYVVNSNILIRQK